MVKWEKDQVGKYYSKMYSKLARPIPSHLFSVVFSFNNYDIFILEESQLKMPAAICHAIAFSYLTFIRDSSVLVSFIH